MSLMNEVRQAIAESHNAIEQTAFSIAMMDGTLSAKNYAWGLIQLLNIHQTLEKSIAGCDRLLPYFTDDMIRTPALERDLSALGYNATSFPLLPDTTAIVQALTTWSETTPFALLGCLYILEGSRMGSLVIAKPLAKTLGIAPGQTAGIEYHIEGASKTPMRVRQLKEQIDSTVVDAPSQQSLKEGAVRFMEMLNQLYMVLPAKNNETGAPIGKCPFSNTTMQTQLRSA
jgi:heme oxygenase (biliverdin-producing, ferredoxin)